MVYEVADLWFHTMVVLARYRPDARPRWMAELARREGMSGTRRKASARSKVTVRRRTGMERPSPTPPPPGSTAILSSGPRPGTFNFGRPRRGHDFAQRHRHHARPTDSLKTWSSLGKLHPTPCMRWTPFSG